MATLTYERRKDWGRNDFTTANSSAIIDGIIKDLEQRYAGVTATRSQIPFGGGRYDSVPVTGPFGEIRLDYHAPGDGTRKARVVANVQVSRSDDMLALDEILRRHGLRKKS